MAKPKKSKGVNEQVCTGSHTGPGQKKVLKKMTRRARRRLEKQDPENAPKKNAYRGYSD